MILIDSHCHLFDEQFQGDTDQTVADAKAAGVALMLQPNVDEITVEALHRLCGRHPQCLPMMGLHPCSVGGDFQNLEQVEKLLLANPEKYVGVGEIGLDYYWSQEFVPQQQEAFRRQLGWAKQLGKAASVHTRDSLPDALSIVAEEQDGSLRGVFHCFSGNAEQARQAIASGWMLGIGGVATFKNGGLDKVLPHIGLEHLVLETDSPYLAPVPHRGKRNSPAYIPLIARRVAELKQVDVEEVARATTQNALRMFGLQLPNQA